MPIIQNQVSIAAAGSTNNLLAGSAFEFARTNELVSIGVTQSVTGGFIGITIGDQLILEDTPPFIATAYPIVPDEMYYNAAAQVGDRIVIRARNPSGGAIVFNFVVQISPIR